MMVEGLIPELFSQERVTRQYGEAMRKEGFEQGYKEGKLEAVLSLLNQGIITEDDAAGETGMTVEAFRKATTELANASDGELSI